MDTQNNHKTTPGEVLALMVRMLRHESSFYSLAIVYGIGISLLSLATPISVQMLINTVANTGLTISLVVLTVSLFVLLLMSGFLNALRIHIMDLFQRRLYARMVSEIALKTVYALNPFFDDQRQSSLFNRYFDIVIVQKNLPNMLIGGFTIILQTAVGFVLVSLYHPLFLIFNLVMVALIWLIWIIWGKRAISSAIQVSHAKHATAAWLENLSESNGFFKAERKIHKALDNTDAVTANYISAHEAHFRHHFAQTLSFLFLYALASASLLGLGGWLVIQGQLSLGQLVAAELVLSVAFFGISQLGIYLAYFYELCGSIDELALFDKVRQEIESGDEVRLNDSSVQISGVAANVLGNAEFDFALPAGGRVMGIAETHGLQRGLAGLLRRLERAERGYLKVGGIDIMSILPSTLRQQVLYLARPTLVDMTMREYLDLSGSNDSLKSDLEVLTTVGLNDTIARLPDGLDTRLSSSGWPLSITETMQLRLAAAIIAEPRVLILNRLFDVIPDDTIRQSLDLLQSKCDCLVIYFTGKYRDLGYQQYLWMGIDSQQVYESLDALSNNVFSSDSEIPRDRYADLMPSLSRT